MRQQCSIIEGKGEDIISCSNERVVVMDTNNN